MKFHTFSSNPIRYSGELIILSLFAAHIQSGDKKPERRQATQNDIDVRRMLETLFKCEWSCVVMCVCVQVPCPFPTSLVDSVLAVEMRASTWFSGRMQGL